MISLQCDGSVALNRILVPTDHDPDPQTALEKAVLLARGLNSQTGEFRLIHVTTNSGKAPLIDLPLGRGWSFETILSRGEVVDEILEVEADWHPDLMVMTTQGHMDFLDALRGSTTERVLRGAHCPVLAVPANPSESSA